MRLFYLYSAGVQTAAEKGGMKFNSSLQNLNQLRLGIID